MAIEVYNFAVTVLTGTTKTAPQITNMPMPPRIVQKIVVVVPPGPRGNVGFQIGLAGQQLIPITEGQFFITDNEVPSFELDNLPTSGAWQLIAYNTGTYSHTLQIRFYAALTSIEAPGISSPIDATQLPAPVLTAPSDQADQGGGVELPPLPEPPPLPDFTQVSAG